MSTSFRVPRAAIIFGTILTIALLGGAFVSAAGTGTGRRGTGGGHAPDCTDAVLTSSEMANLPLNQGIKACAAKHICEGQQTVDFQDIPACAGAKSRLTVWCLNSWAEWHSENVHMVMTSADGSALLFFSDQRGICGFFPGAAPLQAPVIAGH